MTSTANRLAAAMLLAAMVHAHAAAPTSSSPAASNLALLDPAQLARNLDQDHELDRDHGLNRADGRNPLRFARQQQLERGIEDAYAEAHRAQIEDVTNAQDGTDKVYRIKTPYGVNACLNWRDLDRFNPGRGKALFVGACNR